MTYVPDLNYHGDDSFNFFVQDSGDGNLSSNTATISITVDSSNDDPDALSLDNQDISENEDSGIYVWWNELSKELQLIVNYGEASPFIYKIQIILWEIKITAMVDLS